jgi:hypothetical protein
MADKEGQGCHWRKKCPLCQQYCNYKVVNSQLCHKVVNGKVVVTNEQIRTATSSPRPFGLTGEDYARDLYLSTYLQDAPGVWEYELWITI